jgi:hypothetical protein
MANPVSASARASASAEIVSTSEAPKQWQGARFERARLTASAPAKRPKRAIAATAAATGTTSLTRRIPSASSAAISAPPTAGAALRGTRR